MSITGKTLAELRAVALTGMSTRAAAAGITLDTSEGSDAWKEADALASLVLPYEGRAEEVAREIDPRTASEATVDRWMAAMQATPGDGVAGVYTVRATGRDGTWPLGARVLVKNGRRYVPQVSEIEIVGGTADFSVEAAEAGTDAALAVGASVAWDAAPVGLNPTTTVQAITTTAVDADGAEDKRASVILRMRARPAGGNPAQIAELAERHASCAVAYVYPTMAPHPNGQADANTFVSSRLDTPGTFTVLVMGGPQGSDPVSGGTTHARSRTLDQANAVRDFLLGTHDVDGSELGAPVGQRFSTQVLPADVAVAVPSIQVLNVEVTVTALRAQAAGWTGTMAVVSSTTTTVTVAGDQSAKAGKTALFYVGIGNARGGWVKRTIATPAPFGGVNTVLTLDEALPAVAAGTVYPALGHWETLRDAYFAFFDSLGPGDVPSTPAANGTSRRRRFPPIGWGAKDDVNHADLLKLAFTSGTLNATVVAPAADSPAGTFWLYVLGTLLIRPA